MIYGDSIVDGINIATFSAELRTDSIEQPMFGKMTNDMAAYKTRREQVRADQAAFEDLVFKIQDEMIAEMDIAE